jgi:predicted enzyme related to lactoylglutathione lyase
MAPIAQTNLRPGGHTMANPFVHIELCTEDPAAAKDFYTNLFGWTFNDEDMGNGMTYSTFKPDTGPGGGLFSMPGVPTAWLNYVGVEDIHTATEKAKSLGATVLNGPQQVKTYGWMTVLKDPTGAAIALWQPTM